MSQSNERPLFSLFTLPTVYSLTYDYTQRQQLAHINTASGPTPWFQYTYDLNGNLTKRQNVYQGMDSTNFQYDQLNRPTLCEQTGAGDAVFLTNHYGYDLAGNMQYTYRNQQQGKGERFGYDFANQLTSVVYNADNVTTTTPINPDRNVSYTNTPLNRTSMNDNGVVTNYTPNGLNQYTAVTGQTPVYNGNFHLYSYGGWTYIYDADGRLTSASGNGQSAQFVYDGLGRCVKRTINGGEKVFTYDGWKPIAEWSAAGTLVAWNIYGPGADEILTRTEVGVSSYLHYHLDPMGNVQSLLDAGNNGIEKYTYDVFGQPKITDWNGNVRTTSAYGNRFMFTGREYLSPLGIYDYRRRAYHPGLGRFLQTDPIGFGGGDANLFRYCGNNPVNRSDPSGLQVTIQPLEAQMSREIVTGAPDWTGANSVNGFREVTAMTGGLEHLNQGGGRGGGGRAGGFTITRSRDSSQLGVTKTAPTSTRGWWTHPNGLPTGSAWVITLVATSEIQGGFGAGIKSIQSLTANIFGDILSHWVSVGYTPLLGRQDYGSATFSATTYGNFGNLIVNMTGAAQSAWLAPILSIDYNFDVGVNFFERTATLTGFHDGYPSYGVTANGNLLYNSSERGFWDLLPGMEVVAKGSTNW